MLLTPGAFMVEHAAVAPIGASSSTARTPARSARHRSPAPLPRAGRRGDAAAPSPPAATIEWTPVVTADGQFVAYLQSDAQRRRCRGPAARRRPGAASIAEPIAFPPTSRRRALVVPQQITFTSADGVTVHGQLFKTAGGRDAAAGVRLRARRSAAADAARLALHGLLLERLRHEPVPRQPRLRRAIGELPPRHRLWLRVPSARATPARAAPRNTRTCSPAAAYLQGRDDVDPTRIGIWGGSYGGYLTALALGRNSDLFAAGRRYPRRPRLGASGPRRAEPRSRVRRRRHQRRRSAEAARVAYESSPISAVKTWTSPGPPDSGRRRPQRRIPPDRGSAPAAATRRA